jgi:WD40-like Beta Propeller Repeat
MRHCIRRRPSRAPAVATMKGRVGYWGCCRRLFLGLVALALLALPAASSASTIVWARSDKDGSRQRIVAARPDGSWLHAISQPKKGGSDIDAQISPNGRRVVWERDFFDESILPEIHVADISGKHRRKLDLGCVAPCLLDSGPTWLRGGGRLAYTPVIGPSTSEPATSAVLQTSRLDGSSPRRLSEHGIDGRFEDYYADYSRDGSYVVFLRARLSPDSVAVFRMDADGTDVRRLTPWKLEADTPDLSLAKSGPTKDLAVFETYGHGGPPKGKASNVATVPTTCAPVSKCRKQIRYLTRHRGGPVASFNPSWSPNGRRIAYTRFKDRPCCLGDIWTMRPDGSHRRAVSKSPLFEYRPDWGPAPTR